MLFFEIDKRKLKDAIKKISSWDDWNKLESEVFRLEEWPEKSVDILEGESNQPAKIIDGYEWKPVTDSYDIAPEVLYLYEKTRWEVFAMLEPDADKENKSHPELYGKWCVYCKAWTRKFPENNCPICNKELLPITLND